MEIPSASRFAPSGPISASARISPLFIISISSLGQEISNSLDRVDYLFLGVSSGGTITGVSNKIKETFPGVKIIAVDIVGSVIFGNPPKKRFIPGIGSSMVPDILQQAKIDDIVMMDESTTIDMCRELLHQHFIFAGGSSGSVYGAVKKYFKKHPPTKEVNVAVMFPDRGDRYVNTIYNDGWCQKVLKTDRPNL